MARQIGDRICWSSLRQHGVEGRDRAAAFGAVAGAFHQLRQSGEHRGRVAARDGGSPTASTHFALSHGSAAGERVHDQQHMAPLVAEILGDGCGVGAPCRRISGLTSAGQATTTATRQSSSPRLCSMNSFTSRPRSPIRPTTINVGCRIARHHAQQHRLPTPDPGEQAQALAATDGQQAVERADADVQRLGNRRALQGLNGRLLSERTCWRASGRAGRRPAVAVDDAAQQLVADRQAFRPVEGAAEHRRGAAEARRGRRRFDRNDARSRRQSRKHLPWASEQSFAGEPDDFGFDRAVARNQHPAGCAQGHFQAGRLHDQPLMRVRAPAGLERHDIDKLIAALDQQVAPSLALRRHDVPVARSRVSGDRSFEDSAPARGERAVDLAAAGDSTRQSPASGWVLENPVAGMRRFIAGIGAHQGRVLRMKVDGRVLMGQLRERLVDHGVWFPGGGDGFAHHLARDLRRQRQQLVGDRLVELIAPFNPAAGGFIRGARPSATSRAAACPAA